MGLNPPGVTVTAYVEEQKIPQAKTASNVRVACFPKQDIVLIVVNSLLGLSSHG